MRNTLLIALSAALPAISQAAPLFAIGEEVEVFAYARASASYDDNVYLSGEYWEPVYAEAVIDGETVQVPVGYNLADAGEIDDIIWRFAPGLEVQISPDGPGRSVLFANYEWRWYDDESALDDGFATVIFNSAYDSGILRANLDLRYQEFGSNDLETISGVPGDLAGVVVDRDEVRAHGTARYALSTKTAISGGLHYDDRSYDDDRYTGYSSFAIPVTGYYRVSPALDLTLTYRYRDTNVDNSNVDYTDNAVYVGVDGELGSPKIRGEVKVGYQKRDYDEVDESRETPSYLVAITFDATANSTYKLTVARDYYTSANQGTTYVRTYGTIEANYRLTESWFLDGSITYANSDYQLAGGREEDQLYAYLGVGWQPNEYLTLRAWYRYTDVDGSSNPGVPFNDFTQNLFTVSASVRY